MCQNAHDFPILYNYLESYRTQFFSLEILLYLIANFILLWLFLLFLIVIKFIFTIKQKHYNKHFGGSYTSGTFEHYVQQNSTYLTKATTF